MAAAVTYTYDTASDRMLTASTGSGNGQISVTAEYTNGYLTGVARTAAGTDDQRYGYILDAFGNGTQICVQRKKNGGWGSPLILASYTYDSLNRLSSIGGGVYAKTFGYRDINGSRTTLQVSSLTYTGIGTGGASRSFSHTYDGNGNLSSETDGSGTRSYTYDSTNRLTGITGPGGTAESYSYDGAGNLTYAVRRSGSESSTVSHTYSYSNLRWSDLLTAYDGQAIAYEGQNYAAATGTVTGEAVSGNPVSYYNGRRFSLDWEKGSQLSQAQCGSTVVTYGYDINGVRNHKTVGGTSYTYTTQNGQIVRQESGSTILDIIYDQNCAPYAIRYSADGGSTFATFYYILNLQGDVTELVDENGSTAASYSYDAWGKPLAVQNGTGAIAGSGDIARINPLRYRGYCYDEETGFYYLKSRYYDPETARFINADSAEYTGLSADSLEDTNLFAYCYNNPVMGMDPDGTLSNGWKLAITGTILVASVAVIVATGGVASGPVMCAAISAAEGAITGAAGGAAKGAAVAAATSAVKHRIATGSWKGAGKAAVKAAKQGAIDGAFKGAISGAIKGALRPTHCFVAGTVVLAADGSIAIEQIRKGDLVCSWDEETGNVALKEVVETYENETQELIHLKAGQERIDTTPNHPFYVYEKGWYAAEELRAGDILVTVNGEKVVLELVQHEILESPVKVYNLEVQDYHTYYVSDENVLVHNDCADKISKPKKRRGRSGKQARLRELANDDKLPRHLRAEIQRDIDLIKKGQRKTIRVPKGYELAHRIGYEAKKGYGYKYADLQPILIHRLQHRVMGK